MTTADQTRPDLWRWSARAMASAITSREVSSQEIVESCLERIAETNPAVRALTEVAGHEAITAAKVVDAGDPAGPTGPLRGVPVVLKDNVDQRGHPNTGGIVAAAGQIATEDAPVVAALRNSGAIFVGRSNVPAFSLRWFSENDLHGRTLNPWDAGRTPGGSSGGAASAVASGMVPIAHGNDVGGSIRYPASVCGVVGIRPTVGRVPMWTPTPSWPGLTPAAALMSVEGPLARTVDDLRLALEAMVVGDLRDPSSVPAPFGGETPLAAGAKVGVVREMPGVTTHQAAAHSLEQAAAWLTDAGYHVVDVEVPELQEAHKLWFLLLFEDFREVLPAVEQLGDEGIKQAVRHYYAMAEELWGANPSLGDYISGHGRRTALVHAMQSRFEEVPLLLTPVSAEPAFEHGADVGGYPRAAEMLANQWPMTSVPALGLPAATVPTGVVDGLPTGVQIIGGRFRESWILDAAEAIEHRAGLSTPIDPRVGGPLSP